MTDHRDPALLTGLSGWTALAQELSSLKAQTREESSLDVFFCTIIWPVCFIKTKIVIQPNSS